MKTILIMMAAVMLAGCSAMVSDFSELGKVTETKSTDAIFGISEPWEGKSGAAETEKAEAETPAAEEAPAAEKEPFIEEAEEPSETVIEKTEETGAAEAAEEKTVIAEEPAEPEFPSEPETPAEQVKEDQESAPEPAIIEEEKETVLLEEGPLKISLADGVYTITDSGETVEIKKEDAAGFYMMVNDNNVCIFFNGYKNKLYYMEMGKDGVPLE